MMLLERPPCFKTLVLTEVEARKGMAAFIKGVPDLVDPDFYIQNIQEAARARSEYRSSLLILPADGQLPYTDKAQVGPACPMEGPRRARPSRGGRDVRSVTCGLGSTADTAVSDAGAEPYRANAAGTCRCDGRRWQSAHRPPRWFAAARGRDNL